MTMNPGDRVRIVRTTAQGTITQDTIPGRVGVHWDSDDFAFVSPWNLEHVNPTESIGETLGNLADELKQVYDVACYNDGNNIYAWIAVAGHVANKYQADR